MAAAVTTSAGAPHDRLVHHRGTAYDVRYEPQMRVSMKTVGMSAGTRMSSERCRWTAEVQVERTVRRNGQDGGHAKLLPSSWSTEGTRPGSCAQAGNALEDKQLVKLEQVQRHLAQVAAEDRPTLLADIDAAHALVAAN